ncbi:MAG: LysR family transcriptional regulator [Rhizobiaceae bacterium]
MNDLRNIDLNLLTALIIILEEKNVTRAGERLLRGQPAVSAILNRLRVLFRDDLLVRSGRKMVTTPKADILLIRVKSLLLEVEKVVFNAEEFDPTTSDRVFRLGLPDDQEAALLPPLLTALNQDAPSVRLAVHSITYDTVGEQIDTGEIDLAVTVLGALAKPWQQTKTVGKAEFCCLFNSNLLGVEVPVSINEYTSVPHVLVSFDGTFSGIVDEALHAIGRTRNVHTVVPRFSALPSLLSQLPLMATVPFYVADRYAKDFNLVYCPSPVQVRDYAISMIWHQRKAGDIGDRWFRSCVETVASRLLTLQINDD